MQRFVGQAISSDSDIQPLVQLIYLNATLYHIGFLSFVLVIDLLSYIRKPLEGCLLSKLCKSINTHSFNSFVSSHIYCKNTIYSLLRNTEVPLFSFISSLSSSLVRWDYPASQILTRFTCKVLKKC